MTVQEIDIEITKLHSQIHQLKQKVELLESTKRHLKSKAFIELYSVTKNQVELSDGEGKPWFGTVHEFGGWLKRHSSKRFCEWNSYIYLTSEIIAGRMDREACGLVSDLPE